MHRKLLALTTIALSSTFAIHAQNQPPGATVPVYQVTVIERTVKAVNYQYRNGPTQIDFRGTVLLPGAKGHAVVESKAGRTEIDARFERLRSPGRYGSEYLTYVLWAITPQGQPKNLGEVVANSSDKASLHITTDLQAFGLIVTAEPYAAVRQPSDVVVLENEIRPDTVGQIEPISAKYQLLPRGNYTYNVPADLKAAEGQGPSVSMKQYEAIMEVYQAQNAVQIAQAAGADRYSADTLQKAQTELRNAQQLRDSKADRSQVVMMAREAAETAEDARIIAVKQKQQDEVARVKAQAALEQQRRVAAEQAARTAQIQADADRMQLQQDRVKLNQERAALQEARDQAAEATLAASQPPPPPPPQTVPPPNDDARQKALRASLLAELQNCGLPAIDSPRGLVVTVTSLNGASDRLARVGSILASQRGLTVEVSGNSDVDGPDAERMWRQRADEVRESLIRAGVAPQSISTRYDGASHPLASNATARGREQNRRVEITITGGSIGNQADWDHSYSLRPRQQ